MNRRDALRLLSAGTIAAVSGTGLAPVDGHAREVTGAAAAPRYMASVPAGIAPGTIIVSLAGRRLYHVRAVGTAISYPIATPRDQSLWEGTQIVTAKREWPSWVPTAQMRKENPRLPSFVPGRHRFNPMGARALYLGSTYYRIHGTDAPWLVGHNVSKGCIRMLNDDVIDLYADTLVGTRVTVVRHDIAARSASRPATAGPDQRAL